MGFVDMLLSKLVPERPSPSVEYSPTGRVTGAMIQSLIHKFALESSIEVKNQFGVPTKLLLGHFGELDNRSWAFVRCVLEDVNHPMPEDQCLISKEGILLLPNIFYRITVVA